MVVQRRDLDPFFCQFLHDRAHLIGGEDEITHDQRLDPPRIFWKGEPGAERQRQASPRSHRERHLEVAARQTDAVHTARHLRSGFAEGLSNLTPITCACEGRSGQSSSEHQTQQPSNRGHCHHHLPSHYGVVETALFFLEKDMAQSSFSVIFLAVSPSSNVMSAVGCPSLNSGVTLTAW